MFHYNEETNPLYVSVLLPCSVPQVQGQQTQVREDTEQCCDTEGQIPGAKVRHCHGSRLAAQTAQLVSVCD